MKRAFIVFLSAFILVCTLASCGAEKTGVDSPERESAQTSDEKGSKEVKETVNNAETELNVQNTEPEYKTVKMLAEEAKEFNFSSKVKREANPEFRMAHNIYMDPDLRKTSGRFSAFSIDFYVEDQADDTYWALCNWSMDLTAFKKEHKNVSGGGCYAGVQNTADGTKAIMSFWEIRYLDGDGKETVLDAHRVYPRGEDNRFGGEGEGTNCIRPYKWEADHWYRMQIRCYDDEEGETFAEQWLCDLETGKWTLISRFDTGLKNSYFTGAMSQFMENYNWSSSNEIRSVRFKNIWVKKYKNGQWVNITSCTLSTDTAWDNKKGNYAFGSDGDVFWGITNGYGIDVIKSKSHGPVSGTFTVAEGEVPDEPVSAEG